VPAAGSPSDANLMNAGTANNNSGASFQMPHLMSSGETYVINTNQTGKQIAWINIFEEPT
jgi:hypothetical protein